METEFEWRRDGNVDRCRFDGLVLVVVLLSAGFGWHVRDTYVLVSEGSCHERIEAKTFAQVAALAYLRQSRTNAKT